MQRLVEHAEFLSIDAADLLHRAHVLVVERVDNVTHLAALAGELDAHQAAVDARALVIEEAHLDQFAHAKAVKELRAVAPSLSIELSFAGVQRPEQFDQAFSDVTRANAQALYVIDDPIFFAHRTILLKLASAARLPTIHDLRRFPEAGALVSYGPDANDLFRRSATYVDRILKGTKPADLPVEQATKFELVINLRTAKALGLTIPDKLLALANDVIE